MNPSPRGANAPSADLLRKDLLQLDPAEGEYASRFVELLLATGRAVGASDIHLTPSLEGLELAWRLDGVLQSLGQFPAGVGSNVVARLKVLAGLLTYRSDVPQEGRLRETIAGGEIRVSSFPTLHGERVVLRLFLTEERLALVDDLGLPADIGSRLRLLLGETSGAILITGPAGSGKTTTAYACLRELVRQSSAGRSLVSLEDPIEQEVPGVAQSQVNEGVGLTLTTGLRSLLRQDPEVLFVGEIRDRATAEITFQAALTGQLVVTTFHAASATGAISRLSDMGIEPYLLRSGVRGIIGQRLVRRLCDCAELASAPDDRLGLEASSWRTAVGCAACHGTGFQGRLILTELLVPDTGPVGRAILSRGDAAELERLAVAAGMTNLWQRAREAVEAGKTTPAEVRRAGIWLVVG